MQVTVGSQIRVDDPSPELVAWCKETLILPNPDYAKKARMHLWPGNTPQTISLVEQDGNTLVLPYGCLKQALSSGECEVVNELPSDPLQVDYKATVPLYDYQEEAVEALLGEYYGILQSPPGSGKTQMGIALAVALGRKTLWLTHTRDLLTQSKNRAEQYMDASLTGTITEGRVKIGKGITFATVQTMCNLDLARYKDVWDCVIVDECHHVAGTPTAVTQFSKVLNSLAARHKYGLSATVHRADGMIAATYALLGNVAHKVPDEAVADKVMTVTVNPRPTRVKVCREFLDTDGTLIYAKLIDYLAEDFERNALIIGDLILNKGHSCLILSDRLGHLEYLMGHLPREMRSQAVMVTGNMTSKKAIAQRERAIEDMRQGQTLYLFATYALAKEGLDIPRLDRLFLTTPQKDYAVVAQSVGRIARTFPGKDDPVVYDYVDTWVPYSARSFKKRCATYRKCGCKFSE